MQKKTKIIISVCVVAALIFIIAGTFIYIGAKNSFTGNYADFMRQYTANKSEFDYKDYFDISYSDPMVDADESDSKLVGTVFYTVNLTNKTDKAITFGIKMFPGGGYSNAGMVALTQDSKSTVTLKAGQTAMLTATGETSYLQERPEISKITDDASYKEICIEFHLNQKRAYVKLEPNK